MTGWLIGSRGTGGWYLTIHLIQNDDEGPPRCVPLPDDWFMNVAFNYIKFATYSAVPFVVSSGIITVLPLQSILVGIDLLRHAHRTYTV